MKYSDEEALGKILEKGKAIERARVRVRTRLLSICAGTLFAALLLTIAVLPGRSAGSATGSVYGSFLLSMEAGGYVLVGVLAFALGAVLTLLCIHLNKRRKMAMITEKSEKDEKKDQNTEE